MQSPWEAASWQPPGARMAPGLWRSVVRRRRTANANSLSSISSLLGRA